MIWKKGQRVLTAGRIIVRRDSRISLQSSNFNKLVIENLNIHDGGEYSCEIETDDPEPTAVVHTVEILGNLFIYFLYSKFMLSQFLFYLFSLFKIHAVSQFFL